MLTPIQHETIARYELANKLGITYIGQSDINVPIYNERKNRSSKYYYPCISYLGSESNYRRDLLNKYFGTIFYELAKKLVPVKELKFLDVGCGWGTILSFVYESRGFRFKAIHGIEREKKYYELWRDHLKRFYKDKVKIYNIDAFKFNRYYDYDVIYLYVPINNPELMRKLHRRIVKKMNPGAFIFDVGLNIETSFPIINNKGTYSKHLKRIFGPIYQKL